MENKEKLEKIYEVFANKELSFGCRYFKGNKTYRILTEENDRDEIHIEGRTWSKGPYTELKIGSWHIYNKDEKGYFVWVEKPGTRNKDRYYVKFKVIGHPVLIGDVLYGLDSLFNIGKLDPVSANDIETYWENTRLPIEEQSEECVSYIYNLMQD